MLIAILAGAIVAFFLRPRRAPAPPSYVVRKYLLTKAERSFFGVLNAAVQGKYVIFAKVRVADVLMPEKGLTRSRWQTAFNRISAKHFDYVLCDPSDLSVKIVVELNDKSHRRRKRSERDTFLRHVCEGAGLHLVEVDARAAYSIEAVRSMLVPHDGDHGVDRSVQDPRSGRKEPTISS